MVSQEDNLNQEESTADGSDGREAYPKFWIAAYTRPRSERKAAGELWDVEGIETYVPVQMVERQWSDRRKKVEIVVIPMVIFARVTHEELQTVREHRLIHHILSLPGRKVPARIPDDQIKNLRLMLTKSDIPVKFVEKRFKLTDKVRVVNGNLAGLTGSIERIGRGRMKLVVSVDMLGGAMVEIASGELETLVDNDICARENER